jgi:hypothetical protein
MPGSPHHFSKFFFQYSRLLHTENGRILALLPSTISRPTILTKVMQLGTILTNPQKWTNPCFVVTDNLTTDDWDEACLDLGLVAAVSLDLGFVVILTWVSVGSSRRRRTQILLQFHLLL